MIIPLSVKNQSIDSSGITNDYRDAISEYIWNGFEAHARNINIDYTLNEAYGVKELIITDNGDGINYDELGETFGAFLASVIGLVFSVSSSDPEQAAGPAAIAASFTC